MAVVDRINLPITQNSFISIFSISKIITIFYNIPYSFSVLEFKYSQQGLKQLNNIVSSFISNIEHL